MVRLFFSIQSNNTIRLQRLYVDPAYRRKGWMRLALALFIAEYMDCTIYCEAFADSDQSLTTPQLIEFLQYFDFEVLHQTEDGVELLRVPYCKKK